MIRGAPAFDGDKGKEEETARPAIKPSKLSLQEYSQIMKYCLEFGFASMDVEVWWLLLDACKGVICSQGSERLNFTLLLFSSLILKWLLCSLLENVKDVVGRRHAPQAAA